MGETISYSSGKVPEDGVARLVREAREHHKKTLPRTEGFYAKTSCWYIRRLCDALEVKEQEVERLREDNRRLTRLYYQPQALELLNKLSEMEREVERLREALEARKAGERGEDG